MIQESKSKRFADRPAVTIREFRSSVTEVAPRAATDMFMTAVVETRKFPTRYPHIIIERVDVFANSAPTYVEWRALRLQNQRKHMRIGRMLDVTNLSIDVLKLFV